MENKENVPSYDHVFQSYKDFHIKAWKTLSADDADEEVRKLQSQARVYLCTVSFPEKFVIVNFCKLTLDAVNSESSYGEKVFEDIQCGYRNLEKFGVNLMRSPWRREFYSVKLYTFFYKNNIESKVPFGSSVLSLYGYKPGTGQRVVIQEPLDLEHLAKVSFELFLAGVEMKVLSSIARKVGDYSLSMLKDVLKARFETTGDADKAIRYLEKHAPVSTSRKRRKLDREGGEKHDYTKGDADARTDSIVAEYGESGGHDRMSRSSRAERKERLNGNEQSADIGRRDDRYHSSASRSLSDKSKKFEHDDPRGPYSRRMHDTPRERDKYGRDDRRERDVTDDRRERDDRRESDTSTDHYRCGENNRYSRDDRKERDKYKEYYKERDYRGDSRRLRDKQLECEKSSATQDEPQSMKRVKEYAHITKTSVPPEVMNAREPSKSSRGLRYPPCSEKHIPDTSSTYLLRYGNAAQIMADKIPDEDLYGSLNGHEMTSSLITQKHAVLRGHSPELRSRQASSYTVDNTSTHHHTSYGSGRGISEREVGSDYEYIWNPESQASEASIRARSDPPQPPKGVPPPDYANQGYTPPVQQFEGDWVMLGKGVSDMSLASNKTKPPSPLAFRKEILDKEANLSRPLLPKKEIRGRGLEGLHPGMAIPVKPEEAPSWTTPRDAASAVGYPSMPQAPASSHREQRSYPDAVQTKSFYQVNEKLKSGESTSEASAQGCGDHAQVQQSKISDHFPDLPPKTTRSSSPRNVVVSGGEIPVNVAKVTRSDRSYLAGPQIDEKYKSSREQNIYDARKYSGESMADANTCLCGMKATKVCTTCEKVYCDEHALVFEKVPCANRNNHVLVERQAADIKAQEMRQEAKPETAYSRAAPKVEIKNNPISKSSSSQKKCDFCTLEGSFMCDKCLKISCEKCLVYFDTDLCEKDKGSHHFKDMIGMTGSLEKWACERCTFVNEPEYGVCTVCATSRGVTGPQFPVSGSRKCSHCTYGNEEGAKVCAMCHKTLDQSKPESYI